MCGCLLQQLDFELAKILRVSLCVYRHLAYPIFNPASEITLVRQPVYKWTKTNALNVAAQQDKMCAFRSRFGLEYVIRNGIGHGILM